MSDSSKVQQKISPVQPSKVETQTRVQTGDNAVPRAAEGTKVVTEKVSGKSIWERTVGEWLSEAGNFFNTMLQASLELGVDCVLFINFFVLNNRVTTIEKLLDDPVNPKLETYVGYLLNDVESCMYLPDHVLKLLTNEKIFSHANQALRGRVYKTVAASSSIYADTVEKLLGGLAELKKRDQIFVLRELAKNQTYAETQKQVAEKILDLLNKKGSISKSMKNNAYDGLVYIAQNKSIIDVEFKNKIVTLILENLKPNEDDQEHALFALGKFAEDYKFDSTLGAQIAAKVTDLLIQMNIASANVYGVFALCVRNGWLENLRKANDEYSQIAWTNNLNQLIAKTLEDLPKLTKDGQKYAYSAFKFLVEKNVLSKEQQNQIVGNLLYKIETKNPALDEQLLIRSILRALPENITNPPIPTEFSERIAKALEIKKK